MIDFLSQSKLLKKYGWMDGQITKLFMYIYDALKKCSELELVIVIVKVVVDSELSQVYILFWIQKLIKFNSSPAKYIF